MLCVGDNRRLSVPNRRDYSQNASFLTLVVQTSSIGKTVTPVNVIRLTGVWFVKTKLELPVSQHSLFIFVIFVWLFTWMQL